MMGFDLSFLENKEITVNIINTMVLFVIYLAIRIITMRMVSRLKIENAEIKRKWFVYVKNITSVIFFIALILIWASKLETFAISLAAVAAAIAISFKEYFLCLLGGIFKSSSQLFKVGDRIEIASRRGDVIDHDFLTTTLLEIGPGQQLHQFTGRTIVLPNSVFLSNPLINETSNTPIGLHSLEFPTYITDDLNLIETTLLNAAKEVAGPYLEQAKQTYRRVAWTQGIEEPNVEPRISAYFPEAHRVIFILRFPTPIKRKGKTEQEIIRRFLKAIPKEAFDRTSEKRH